MCMQFDKFKSDNTLLQEDMKPRTNQIRAFRIPHRSSLNFVFKPLSSTSNQNKTPNLSGSDMLAERFETCVLMAQNDF